MEAVFSIECHATWENKSLYSLFVSIRECPLSVLFVSYMTKRLDRVCLLGERVFVFQKFVHSETDRSKKWR
jgi:hypothetical protein